MALSGGARGITIGAGRVGTARAAGIRDILRQTGHLEPGRVWLAATGAGTLVPRQWLEQQVR